MRGGAQTDAGHAAFPCSLLDRALAACPHSWRGETTVRVRGVSTTSNSTRYPAFRKILIRLAMLLLAQLPP